MMPSLIRTISLFPALFSTLAYAVHPVDVRGSTFIDTVTNQTLSIVGVDYQPGGAAGYKPQEGKDVLSNEDVCLRDATILQKLGVNTIRVYNIDPKLDHSACASIFNMAGIYIMLDVNSPLDGESLNRAEPWTSYNSNYMNRVFGIAENFKDFPNTLGFFSANEVINDMNSAMVNPQYIRAVQRDLKAYIKKHASRPIPVGYSAADVRDILKDTWNYLQCDNGDGSSSDFFGLNSYSWCGGDATIQTSGYLDLVGIFNSTAIPVFFSEYGCNKAPPRVFNEVAAIYGSQMTSFSGGLVYEYSVEGEADGNFGLVALQGDGSAKLQKDFDNFQGQLNKIDVSLAASKQGSSATAPKCDSSLITNDKFDNNFTIPAICPGCQDLIDNGAKDAKNGKLQPFSSFDVKQAVFGSGGNQINGLSLSPPKDDSANAPSNQMLSGGASASNANGNGQDKKRNDAEMKKRSWAWAAAGSMMATYMSQ